MALTAPQLAALKAAITANPTWAAFPLSEDGYFDLARALNQPAVPNFWVWSTTADVAKVRAAIVWSAMTPADAPDGTQAWANRSLQCQGKQFNLQTMIPFTGTLNGADANVRAGLQDALQGVRSGPGGVTQDAGWTAVRNSLARAASYGEKILADTAAGNGATRATAATMVFEGELVATDVAAARAA